MRGLLKLPEDMPKPLDLIKRRLDMINESISLTAGPNPDKRNEHVLLNIQR